MTVTWYLLRAFLMTKRFHSQSFRLSWRFLHSYPFYSFSTPSHTSVNSNPFLAFCCQNQHNFLSFFINCSQLFISSSHSIISKQILQFFYFQQNPSPRKESHLALGQKTHYWDKACLEEGGLGSTP